jgi:hypothetical protein
MNSTSTQLLVQVIATVSALTVAFIAGGFSLLGLIMAKEQKTSEFRQQWIDGLRADIAIYVAAVTIIKAHIELTEPLDAKEFLKEIRQDYIDLNQASFRIKLRLNATEANSQAILEPMTTLEKKLNADSADIKAASAEIRAAMNELEESAPKLLKKEWKRVKKGELTYKVAKYGAALFCLASVVTVGLICHHFFK